VRKHRTAVRLAPTLRSRIGRPSEISAPQNMSGGSETGIWRRCAKRPRGSGSHLWSHRRKPRMSESF
jgi:hypothetical protein